MNSPILYGEIQPARLSQNSTSRLDTSIITTTGNSLSIGLLNYSFFSTKQVKSQLLEVDKQDALWKDMILYLYKEDTINEMTTMIALSSISEKRWTLVNPCLLKQESLRFTGHACLNIPFEHCASNVMLFGGWDGDKYTNQITIVNVQNKQVRQSIFIEPAMKSDAFTIQKSAKSTLDAKLFLKTESPQKPIPMNPSSQIMQPISSQTSTYTVTEPSEMLAAIPSQATPKLVQHNQSKKSIQKFFPPGVRDHSLVYDPIRNAVLLFGGWDSMKFEFGSNEYNNLWLLDSKWDWHNVKTSGDIPRGRRGHSCVLLQQPYGLLVFGGIHGQNKMVNLCHFLDLKNFVWSLIQRKPNSSFYPPPTAFHSATLLQDKIIYYGGLTKPNKISNQVALFIFMHNITHDVWSELDHTKSVIPPLMMHTAIRIDENEIYILGGVTEDTESHNKQRSISLDQIYKIRLESLDGDEAYQSNMYPQSPKRNQKEEQLQWNVMAFPALEVLQEKGHDFFEHLIQDTAQFSKNTGSEQTPIPIFLSNDLDSFQLVSETQSSPHTSVIIDRSAMKYATSSQPNGNNSSINSLCAQGYSKSLWRKLPNLSEVIEEKAKEIEKCINPGSQEQAQTKNRLADNKVAYEDEDDEYEEQKNKSCKMSTFIKEPDQKATVPSPVVYKDPFENFPESETDGDGVGGLISSENH